MHEALVHALRLHVAEAEATEVAGAGRDARERMLGHSFHREGRDELRVPVEVVPDAHVAKLGVIGARISKKWCHSAMLSLAVLGYCNAPSCSWPLRFRFAFAPVVLLNVTKAPSNFVNARAIVIL